MAYRRSAWFACLVATSLFAAACGDKSAAKKDASSESDEDDDGKKKKKGKKGGGDDAPAVDDATQKLADELAKKVKNAQLPSDVTKEKGNAVAVVHLARTAKDVDVAVAALRGMETMFTASDKSKDRTQVDAGYHGAVLARLDDAEPRIQAWAMQASTHSMSGEKGDAPVVAKMIGLAASHPTPAGRYAAVDQIWVVRDLSKNEAGMAALVGALDAKEPWLVSMALFRLKSSIASYAKKNEVRPKLEALLGHADPGVRGRAAEALGSIAGFDKAMGADIAKKVMPLLSDSNAFTKSAAMGALSWMGHAPAIHEIVKHVDDGTSNTYDIGGFTGLDGMPGRVHHDGSAWSRTSDAALYALKGLSRSTKQKFEYKIDYKTVDADLKKAAGDAKAWYAKVKADVPKG